MNLLSRRITNLKESATIKMAALGRELRAKGIDIIDLSLGEPDFNTPQYLKDAAIKAIEDNYSHYTPVPGYMEVREAISKKFKRDNDLDYSAKQIVTSTGAKQTLANIILCLVNPGDEVIVPIPYWVSYSAMIQLAEGKKVEISSDINSDYKISPEQLEEAITDKTKVFMFSSPCNPSGSVYSRSELAGLVSVLENHPNVIVISDEIYEYINFTNEHVSIGTFNSIADRVVTVNGLSKGFAMTGWRLGFMGAPLWLANAVSKMQGQFTSATCSITQRATITAMLEDNAPTREMKKAFIKRREIMINELKQIPGIKINEPQGAFYMFPDVSEYFGCRYGDEIIENADDLSMYLLNHAHVSVVTGSAFGSPKCIRMSYATSEDKLILAASQLKTALSILKR